MKMSERDNVSRENIYLVPPEELTIITDKDHPLYDERVKLPLSVTLVASVKKRGIIVPILVRRNGELLEVVEGRQRVRAALAANEEMAKNGGGDPIRVRYRMVKGEDKDMGEIMVIANAYRVEDPPSMRASKMQRYIDKGYADSELSVLWNVTPQTIKNTVELLNCTPKVRKAVDALELTEGAARELSRMPREKQDDALVALLEAGQGKGTSAKTAARSVRKTGKVKKKNVDAKKMRARHWLEGWLTALEELGDKPRAKVASAVINFILGDAEALSEFTDLGGTAARVNRDGTLVDEEAEE